MNTPRFALGLTLLNVLLLAVLLSDVRARDAAPVLRGRELEIVDDQGRVRASIKIHPPGTSNDGKTNADTVVLRLINLSGQPGIKIATALDQAGVAVIAEGSRSYVQLGTDGNTSSLRLLNRDGREQTVRP